MIDMLMVKYKSEQFERQAIESILKNTDVGTRLAVVDNNESNASLTTLWNNFARQSQAEFLCFVNPDVVCAKGWAGRLLRAFSHPDVMVATPSTPVNPRSSAYPCSRRQALLVDGVYRDDGGVNVAAIDRLGEILPPIVVDDPVAHGYCYCVRRAWFMDLGLFDADFPYYTQETEFNYRTIKAGKRVVCVKNSVVLHHGQGSSGGSRTAALHEASAQAIRLLHRKHPEWHALFGLY